MEQKNLFIQTEEPAQLVIPDELKDVEPKVLAEAIVEFLDGKKGIDIATLYVEDKTSLTSYFVIATGSSTTHVKALGDEVDFQTSRRGCDPISTEGRAGGAWVLLDYGPVIVHIFTRDAREFYNIEHMFAE